MTKGKHNNSYVKVPHGNHNKSQEEHTINYKKIIFFIIFILIISLLIYFFVFREKIASTQSKACVNSQINISKQITGLDDIEILNVNVQNSTEASIIEISLNNTSSNKILGKKVHLYLLDNNGSIVFGSSLKLPNMEPNSQTDFSIACSDNIENVADYEIVLD